MTTKVVPLSLPEYGIETVPDHEAIGAKIDAALNQHFAGKHVALRAVSHAEHKELTLDQFVDAILKAGTDRYDPARKPADDDPFAPYKPDLHAGLCTIGKDHWGEGADFVKKFYENILLDRGYRLRIDLMLVYDASQLERATKVEAGQPSVRPELEVCLFRFRNPADKPAALLGVLKLLS